MIRGLTAGEQRLAREALGDAVELAMVRFFPTPWPFDRAFVPGRWFGRVWIAWPARQLPADVAKAPLRLQSVLVHELVHVWQAQTGVNLLTAKLKAGDRVESYRYVANDACRWDALNIEQQAMVVEHRFRLSRGERTPGDQAFYHRVCPLPYRAA
ncbi:hypothetical protein [uncultured Brevundimonas sp.]|uniref:hypothetical protein n=1 Tax=uncultured Brevundimonas sp. TaxID=213418 RepID=UPI0025F212CB|nr:hypothetical protein [uncultured Brevundimonas sp.]